MRAKKIQAWILCLGFALSPIHAFAMSSTSAFNPGDLIKSSRVSTVYYFAQDGKRYVFPNDKTYFTWYKDFSTVKTISQNQLATIPLGGNVTYRPGYKMVKITTDPKVYVVDQGGVLRHVASETLANTLYGLNWQKRIDDIPDAFFVNYRTGTQIQTASDYLVNAVLTATTLISQDKQLDETKAVISIGNKDSGFVPASITVKKGTEVTWINTDVDPHTVKSDSKFDSGILQPNITYKRVFSTTGSFDYHCSIHPVMQGTVNVIP